MLCTVNAVNDVKALSIKLFFRDREIVKLKALSPIFFVNRIFNVPLTSP